MFFLRFLVKNTSAKTSKICKIDLSLETAIFAYQHVSWISPAKHEDSIIKVALLRLNVYMQKWKRKDQKTVMEE